MKKILLTGAAGAVGIEVLKELIKRNYDVTTLDLNNVKNKLKLTEYKCNKIFGDIRNKDLVVELCRDTDVIIHLAAIIPPLADEKPQLAEKVNVGGTMNILEGVKESNKNPFLLYSSSVSVYGDRLYTDDIEVNDNIEASPYDEYAKTKIRCESLIRDSGVKYSIFRLTGVMGKNKNIDPLMFHMPLDTNLEIVTTRDCGYAFVNAIEKEELLTNKTFNLSGGKDCRTIYFDFLAKKLDGFGLNINKFPKYSFAERNFHCGYFADSNKLNDILDFQRDSIESYYDWSDPKISKFKKTIFKILQFIIIRKLYKKSDVYLAVKTNNIEMIKRFLRYNPNFKSH